MLRRLEQATLSLHCSHLDLNQSFGVMHIDILLALNLLSNFEVSIMHLLLSLLLGGCCRLGIWNQSEFFRHAGWSTNDRKTICFNKCYSQFLNRKHAWDPNGICFQVKTLRRLQVKSEHVYTGLQTMRHTEDFQLSIDVTYYANMLVP